MTSVALVRVTPDQLDKADAFWLERLRERMYDAPSASELGMAIASGRLMIWRVVGAKSSGNVALQVVQSHQGAELIVYGLAGSWLLPFIADIFEKIKDIAQLYDCRWITTATEIPQLSYKMEKAGFPQVGVLHRYELGA